MATTGESFVRRGNPFILLRASLGIGALRCCCSGARGSWGASIEPAMGSQGSDGSRELPTDRGKGAEAAIIHSSGAGWEHGLLCQGHNEQRER